MKENESYKENDLAFKGFDLTKKEIKTVSEYFGYEFNADETHLFCMYDLKGNLLAAQVNEESTWDLTPEEFSELFGNKKAA